MNTSFSNLLSPINIGAMTLKNRMVMSPMTTAYCNDDQTPSGRLSNYFEERAKGGVGLITMELITVDEQHRYLHRSMTLAHDKYIDGHRRMVDVLHQHGCKVQPQISHTGPESVSTLFGGPQPVGPSENVAPVWGWASRPLEIHEMATIAIQYGEAARRAREAGYDGVELHSAHCYNLLASFLSPLRNKRKDEYSGRKMESRIRFICEVLAEVRSRAGEDFPITLSISGYERFPGGRSIDDTQRIAPLLVDAGVSCFRVSGGISDSLTTMMVNRSEHGDALNAAQAEAIRCVVDVPVMLVGRLHNPEMAEQVIADGQADLVAMGRPLLADPQLPNKVMSGNPHRIRRCISCENCIDSIEAQDNMGCAVNPLSGREGELLFAQSAKKKVVIVGGGTGGLEAARLAAEAGHDVVLYEKQKLLGGSLFFASTVHADNNRFYRWLLDEVKRLPVTVRLGQAASVELVKAQQPDVVIVATGARVQTPAIPGVENAQILTGALMRQIPLGEFTDAESHRLPSLIRGILRCLAPRIMPLISPDLVRSLSRLWMPIGKRVIIVGSDLAAVELAEFLAHRGRKVHLIDSATRLAPEVGRKRRNEHMDRLDKLMISVNTAVEIVSVQGDAVCIRSSRGENKVTADTVIVAGTPVVDLHLVDQFRQAGIETLAIGDCTGLGLIAKATREAAEAVNRL